MIVKMDNKSKDFYNIMGKFFGSRIVENKTNDRIYDDNNKSWYIYMDNNNPVAFASIANGVIKNIYSVKDNFLIELLKYVSKKETIKDSIVTAVYSDIYDVCGFTSSKDNFKNFIRIRSGISG